MQKAQSADPLRSPTRAGAHGDGDTISSIYTPSSLPPSGPGLSLLPIPALGEGRQLSASPAPALGKAALAGQGLSHLSPGMRACGMPIPATGWGPGLFFSTPGLCAEPPSLLRESRPCQRGGYSCPRGGGGNHNERSLGPLLEVANTQAKEPSARDLLADR